ncbi:F-box domain protein [Apiospora kogelbergensis]|uniref:F-box domain protein n=1 Tax=Apiospora kogelbergensis TaxID=1337665 RepID=UPI00312DF5D6
MEHLDRLPNEILLSIASHLPPAETLAFSQTKKRHNSVVGDSLRWRRRCLETWRYWHESHEVSTLIKDSPLAVSWRKIFESRQVTDRMTEKVFETLLKKQQCRIRNMEDVAALGYDVKDWLLRQRNETPDDAHDVLARRYHADAILGLMHRTDAIDIWTRLAKNDLPVTLEDALGAYDLFVLAGRYGDLKDIHAKLDQLAEEVRHWLVIKIYRDITTRGTISYQWRCSRSRIPASPLQSVAIFCSIARRLDISAQPSNYPGHVYAVVEEPWTRDAEDTSGLPGLEDFAPRRGENGRSHQRMYVDPFHSEEEIPVAPLIQGLASMGVPPQQIPGVMGPTSVAEIARRTGRNLRYSAQRAWKDVNAPPPHVSYETASYADNWTQVLLGDAQLTRRNRDVALEASRHLVGALLNQAQQHFPQDIGLIERLCASLFPRRSNDEDGNAQQPLPHHLDPRDELAELRQADDQPRRPKRRPGSDSGVAIQYRVGQFFMHKNYNYRGFIIGWDQTCAMPEAWIQQMHVNELQNGRHQPFYHIIDSDRDSRYVAQENIRLLGIEAPSDSLMSLAGRYFKRWDSEAHIFVSNLEEEYPED